MIKLDVGTYKKEKAKARNAFNRSKTKLSELFFFALNLIKLPSLECTTTF